MSFNFQEDSSKESSTFSRRGTSKTSRGKKGPSWLQNLGTNLLTSSSISGDTANEENAAMLSLMTKDFTTMPGMDQLLQILQMNPESFTGSGTLQSISEVDPYSDVYKEGVSSLYEDIFKEAGANARTGPDAVRGGANHGAMVEANVLEKMALDKFREITGLQQRQAGVSTQAATALQSIINSRRDAATGAQDQMTEQLLKGFGINLGALDALNKKRVAAGGVFSSIAPDFSSDVGVTRDNLFGKGNIQSSHSGWNAGINLCCAVFLESIDGPLPWVVRRARDLFGTEQMRRGYMRLGRRLIPLMRRFAIARFLVRWTMVRPLTIHGLWFFNAPVKQSFRVLGALLTPVRHFWFKIWNYLGKE